MIARQRGKIARQAGKIARQRGKIIRQAGKIFRQRGKTVRQAGKIVRQAKTIVDMKRKRGVINVGSQGTIGGSTTTKDFQPLAGFMPRQWS